MTHPGEKTLALYAGGDLGLFGRLAVGWHVARCAKCEETVGALRELRESLAAAAGQMPRELNWEALQAEMSANIRLGLAAGQIVEARPKPEAMAGWRTAAALASVAVLVAGGVYLHRPGPRHFTGDAVAMPAGSDEEILVQASADGIELHENGRSLALMRRANAPVTLAVDTGGSARARYIDEETGEVTIHHVYAPSRNE